MHCSQPEMEQFVKPQKALAALRPSGGMLGWSADTEESILDLAVANGVLWKVKFILDLGCRKGHAFDIRKSLLHSVKARQVDVVQLVLAYAVPKDQWEQATLREDRRRAFRYASEFQDCEMIALLTKDQDWQAHSENHPITPQDSAMMKFLATPDKWTRITEDFADATQQLKN